MVVALLGGILIGAGATLLWFANRRVAGVAGLLHDALRGRGTAPAVSVAFVPGLVSSGMTTPQNIVGFLDFFGAFQPKLAFVMAGAVGVHAVALWFVRRNERLRSTTPTRGIDAALLVGAGLFGVGWGLGGYCPGPSLVAAGAGRGQALSFVAPAIVGIYLAAATRTPFGR